MDPIQQTAHSLTGGPLLFAAELLKAKLPGFKIHVLSLPADADAKHKKHASAEPAMVEKLAVELPEAKAHLRVGLMDQLNKRVGKIFGYDPRVPNAVCTTQPDPKKVYDKIDGACKTGSLEGLTLDHLEEVTPSEKKEQALQEKVAAMRTVKPTQRGHGGV